jgi:hypothetical protein
MTLSVVHDPTGEHAIQDGGNLGWSDLESD